MNMLWDKEGYSIGCLERALPKNDFTFLSFTETTLQVGARGLHRAVDFCWTFLALLWETSKGDSDNRCLHLWEL